MKLEDKSRRDFLQRVAGWGLACATGSYLTASLVKGQNPPLPPPEPPDTTWTATIVPSGEPGDPLVVAGRVFRPDGEHTVAGVVVYAYTTDKDGYYSPDGKVGHPRIKGYMKGDPDGPRFVHFPGIKTESSTAKSIYACRKNQTTRPLNAYVGRADTASIVRSENPD